MERNEDDLVLERIKDGSVIRELTNYFCLHLKKSEIEPFDCIVKYNKKGVLPKMNDLVKSTGKNSRYLWDKYRELRNRNIVSRFTFPQIFRHFGCYVHQTPKLPESLDEATQEEFHSLRSYNFHRKMNKNPLASYWPRFYLALATETNIYDVKTPVFQSIFDFLPHFQTKPLSA